MDITEDKNYLATPGEILRSYILDYGYTQKNFAKKINTSDRHLSTIVNDKTKITVDFALKLEKVFKGYKAEYWLNMEMVYILRLKREARNEI